MKTVPFRVFLLAFSVTHIVTATCSSSLYSCPAANGEGYSLVAECLHCGGGNHFEDTTNMVCARRQIFSADYFGYDTAGTLIWFLTAGIATACGVGGGGIYVPMGMLVVRFAAKTSSGLSQASIAGASLGGLLLNLYAMHPNQKIVSNAARKGGNEKIVYYTRPLIDYDMTLFLAPMVMAGAVLGVLVQKVLPNWLYLCCAIVISGITAFLTWRTYFRKRQGELDASAAKNSANSEPSTEGVRLNEASSSPEPNEVPSSEVELSITPSNDVENLHLNDSEMETSDDTDENVKARIAFLELDSRQFPAEKLCSLGLLWLVLLLLTFLVGGKGVKSLVGVECSDTAYPVLIVVQFAWLLGFSLYFGLKVVDERKRRDAVNYPWQSTDVVWSKSNLILYSKWCFLAGVISGVIGIGGGMVLGPLMLTMGVDPRVSTATTATMIVMTASSVSIMYAVTGYISWDYYCYFSVVCILGAYFGKGYIDAYVKRTGMASMLVGLMATIISLSVLGFIVILFTNLGNRGWCIDGFTALCVKTSD